MHPESHSRLGVTYQTLAELKLLSRRCDDAHWHIFSIELIALFALLKWPFDLFPNQSDKLDTILYLFANRDCIRAKILRLS